jgi:hypothetical protein
VAHKIWGCSFYAGATAALQNIFNKVSFLINAMTTKKNYLFICTQYGALTNMHIFMHTYEQKNRD